MVQIKKFRLEVVKESNTRFDLENKRVGSPCDLHKIGNLLFNFDLQAEEVFSIVTLDTKNNVTGAFEVSRGALNGSIVHPREVFKRAILQNASSIALMHNHPSGDPKPSSVDLQMTKRLEEAGKILGISILDHIIFGDYFFSFKEEGLIWWNSYFLY